MTHGGPRSGAGRKKGVSTKLNEEARKEVIASGMTPLDYMLGILRNDQADEATRFEAAKAAAPYVHARLSSVEQKSDVTVRNVVALPETAGSVTEWQASVAAAKVN